VHDNDADRLYQHQQSKSQARFRGTRITRDDLRQIADNTWYYYVRGVVRKTMGDPHGMVEGIVWQKPATYDERIDADWSVGDVQMIPGKPRPGAKWTGGGARKAS